jgi:sugar-specific transcriptional regulator TrmB
MDTEDLRDALEDAGLSQYQAEAYTALLRLGTASATELADACAVPTARIYDVLRDLEGKGYIETYEQGSLHARARDPEEVLSDLRSRASLFSEAADEIEDRWEAPAVDPHKVSIVKRFDTVTGRAKRAISEARNEVQVSATPAQFRELRPALVTAVENGAIVKLSVHGPKEPAALPMDDLPGAVTEARFRDMPTPFVALIDRTKTCFAPHARSVNQYGVLVDDYTLTYVFHWYFLTCLWEVWETVYATQSDEPPLTYADIRRCVRDVEPLLIDGKRVTVRIDGFEIETGDTVSFEGVLVDVDYSGERTENGPPPLSQLAGQVTLSVESDGRIRTVGGWGSVVEEIEATRITVVGIGDTDES